MKEKNVHTTLEQLAKQTTKHYVKHHKTETERIKNIERAVPTASNDTVVHFLDLVSSYLADFRSIGKLEIRPASTHIEILARDTAAQIYIMRLHKKPSDVLTEWNKGEWGRSVKVIAIFLQVLFLAILLYLLSLIFVEFGQLGGILLVILIAFLYLVNNSLRVYR